MSEEFQCPPPPVNIFLTPPVIGLIYSSLKAGKKVLLLAAFKPGDMLFGQLHMYSFSLSQRNYTRKGQDWWLFPQPIRILFVCCT